MSRILKTFDEDLKEQLKDPEFAEMYEEERLMLELSYRIHQERKKAGLTQSQLANKANITQQQLSRIERGLNYNIKTILKVCCVLGVNLSVIPRNLKTT